MSERIQRADSQSGSGWQRGLCRRTGRARQKTGEVSEVDSASGSSVEVVIPEAPELCPELQ